MAAWLSSSPQEDNGDFLEHLAERHRWCARQSVAGLACGGERRRLVAWSSAVTDGSTGSSPTS